MFSHISINDTDPMIGEKRLDIINPLPPPSAPADFSAILVTLASLQSRIEALERRTWWSMLKDWVRTWFSE